jgi:hypothetical protein
MRLKRRVFEECERVTPANRPLRQWLTGRPLMACN